MSRKLVSLTTKLATQAPVNGGRNYDGPKVEFSAHWFSDKPDCTLLYAGTSEYLVVRSVASISDLEFLISKKNNARENLSSADNQQETISLVRLRSH